MCKIITPIGKKSRTFIFPAVAVFLLLLLAGARAVLAEDAYAGLKQKLVDDGFSRPQVQKVFQAVPPPMYNLVSKTFRMRESQLNYDQFLEPSEIAKARRFISMHRDSFRRSQKVYGVEPGVIAAILLVETHFGSYTGNTSTLAVFTTFAVMDWKANRDRIWKLLAPQDRERLGREAFDRKLLDRSAWAYKELSALIQWSKANGVSPDSFHGSVMGAFGWPQFLPSSLVEYGADGNADGRIDLFNPEDAIFSTANYLKGHGWCQARFPLDQEQVIWTYNHSKPYVRTILGIADRLKGDGAL